MAIFNSYVSLPEGKSWSNALDDLKNTAFEELLDVTYAFPVLPSASVTHLDAQIGERVIVP